MKVSTPGAAQTCDPGARSRGAMKARDLFWPRNKQGCQAGQQKEFYDCDNTEPSESGQYRASSRAIKTPSGNLRGCAKLAIETT